MQYVFWYYTCALTHTYAHTRTYAHLCDAGSSEGHNHSHHIDSELKLQELGDAVIHIATPHHGLHYAGEVVICQDDVRGLLGHICPSDSLIKSEENKSGFVFITRDPCSLEYASSE